MGHRTSRMTKKKPRNLAPHYTSGDNAGMRRESLADLSAAEMTAGYRRREFTPLNVFEATMARIDEVNPALNAFVLLDLDGAKKVA